MKKLIMLFCLFVMCTAAQAQWISFPFTLVDDNGDPMTGQASNIKFTKYPHSYPGDVISDITITEVGTQGTYNASGFTSFQYVKMWLSGVERHEFDSLLTGNIFTYLQSNYWRTNAAQTGLTGSKSIASGNWTITTGDWLKLGGTETWYKPYIYSSSPWYTDISNLGPTSLVFKNASDSFYVPKDWMYSSESGKIRLQLGYKLYGRTNSVSPIPINTNHFTYTSDQLSLNSSVLNADSIKHNNLTIGKDSTWTVLGEGVSKWKFLSLKKGFYSTSGNVPDWKWYYKSFDESGTLIASDSFAVINDVISVDVEGSVTLGTSNTKLDSVYLTAGYWSIDFGFVYHFSDASLGSPPTVQPDSIIMAATKSGGSTLFDNVTTTYQYVGDVNYGRMGTLTWHTNVQVTTPIWIYLNGRRKNTETGYNHTTKHHYISAFKVK